MAASCSLTFGRARSIAPGTCRMPFGADRRARGPRERPPGGGRGGGVLPRPLLRLRRRRRAPLARRGTTRVGSMPAFPSGAARGIRSRSRAERGGRRCCFDRSSTMRARARATCSAAPRSTSSRSSIRTSSSSTAISRRRRRSGRRSWRCSRRTCRPTTSPACRRSSSGPARPPISRANAGVEFEHTPLADGDVVELGNTIVTAISTPGHAPAHLAFTVADRRRGTLDPWLVFTGDSLLVGDVGRPDLHAPGDPEPPPASSTPRLQKLLRAGRRGDRLAEPHRRLCLRPRIVGQPVLLDRLRAPPQRGARARRRGRVRAALLVDLPPRPAEQAAIVAANRSGRSAQRRVSDGPARPARERRPVRAARRDQRARRRDGRARAHRAAADRRAGLRAHLEDAAILTFIVAFGLAKAFTNLAAGTLADRVGRKRLLVLGWLLALPVPLLIGIAPTGASSSSPTCSSAPARASPGR